MEDAFPRIYWSPLAVNYLVQIIIIGLQFLFLSSALWSQRGRAVPSGQVFAATAFLSSLMMVLLQFLAYALPDEAAAEVLPWISSAGVASVAAVVLYALHFDERPLLARRGRATIWIGLGAIFAAESAIAIARHHLLLRGIVEYRDHWTNVPFAALFLVATGLFFAHLVRALVEETGLPLRPAILRGLAVIAWPAAPLPRKAAAARGFLYFTLTPLFVVLLQMLRSFGAIDWRTTEMIASWQVVVVYSTFSVVYLNYVPDRSSFRVKLVGLTLITTLSIVSGMSWLIGSAYGDAYAAARPLASRTALIFVPIPEGGYNAARTAFAYDPEIGARVNTDGPAVDLPFPFPFFGQDEDRMFLTRSGMVGFDGAPRIQDVLYRFGPTGAIFLIGAALDEDVRAPRTSTGQPSGVYVRETPTEVLVTWVNLVSAYDRDARYTFQLRLEPDGAIGMAFLNVPERPRHDFYDADAAPLLTGIVPPWEGRKVAIVDLETVLPLSTAAWTGIVELRRPAFRAYLNQIYAPIAVYILMCSIVVIAVFPLFFQVNLVRPLEELMTGVRQIMGGKLATDITVYHRDEIGFLAASFNDMAVKQNELIETLEDKVAQRTADVSAYADRNARLEERNNLSRELHDAVSQTLFSANLMTDRLSTLFRQDPERAGMVLADVQHLIRGALVELRQVILELRPWMLEQTSFGSLLRGLAVNFERSHGFHVSVRIDDDAVLPPDVQLAFCRIAHESIVNCARYAGTAEADVYFDAVAGQAILVVEDRGCGFDLDAVLPGHLGLQVMRERMQTVGGTLEIETTPGKGTKVTAIWMNDQHDEAEQASAG